MTKKETAYDLLAIVVIHNEVIRPSPNQTDVKGHRSKVKIEVHKTVLCNKEQQ